MFLKLLTVIIVILAAGMMFSRRPALSQRRTAQPAPSVPCADDLVKCQRCGVWLPAGQLCDCAGRP